MSTDDLEQKSKIADAELGVAEELGWGIALLAGAVGYLKADSWLVAIAVGVAAYYLSTLRYRRRSAAAEDSYFKAAKLGKHIEPRL